MKIGLYSMNFGTFADPDVAVAVAQYAEAAGFESVWVGEHVALPRHPPEWFTMPCTLPFLDAVVGLTLLAAHTSKVKIGSGILELPLHNPVRLAKQLASIDRISHGRLIVGVERDIWKPSSRRWVSTSGSCRPHGRVRRCDACTVVDGRTRVPRTSCRLRRHRRLPVRSTRQVRRSSSVVSAVSARRRAIRSANGWFAYNTTVEWTRDILDVIAMETKQIDRPAALGPLELTIIPAGPFDRATADQYEELGVDRIIVLPRPDAPTDTPHVPVPFDEIRHTIDTVAAELDL